ncbi:uncharacterized protein A1O5_04486 [Cladophialophora psammophila CBS 110553]|uniref:DNA2/NAM7 helicase-like C-terminal domain-containing protein n=1 Tax=Cladophialophora psammophila CBS 110553 TaxID=1182543 RepID=W9XNR2_9EURO|nr:uncharacterized protein A1O5_04486 [Cladophialophora psammophila CBS 110553]EXJ71984.1 hypothetical protein A1O5_04486 [Cladophialophora psammophila CBS 110553]
MSKAQMEEDYPAAKDVALQPGDIVQSLEYDPPIVDPTVVRSPGFLDVNRLNVMFSRARYGLYVVGNYNSCIAMWREDSRTLRQFAKEFKRDSRATGASESNEILSSPFFDDDMIQTYDSG